MAVCWREGLLVLFSFLCVCINGDCMYTQFYYCLFISSSVGFMYIPPCVWGSAEEGLQPPPVFHLDTNLMTIARTNSTDKHYGTHTYINIYIVCVCVCVSVSVSV